MIKGIIFDCFGVLTTDGWLAFRERYLEPGSEADEQARVLNWQADAGIIGHEAFIAGIAQLSGVAESDVAQLINGHVRNDALFTYIKSDLKPSHSIGLLSNAAADRTGTLFEPWQQALFDAKVFSFELGVVKPDPVMYQTIAAKLGYDMGECVFIDDREGFVGGARAVGMEAIWFRDNQQCQQELAERLGTHRA